MVLVVKNPPVNARDIKFDPWVSRRSWRRARQHSAFLLENAMGRRSLAGCSPHKVTKVRID